MIVLKKFILPTNRLVSGVLFFEFESEKKFEPVY